MRTCFFLQNGESAELQMQSNWASNQVRDARDAKGRKTSGSRYQKFNDVKPKFVSGFESMPEESVPIVGSHFVEEPRNARARLAAFKGHDMLFYSVI